MILSVTLNAALDITYWVDRLDHDRSHRVTAVRERAGGKGLNVGRVLASLGHEVVTTGLVGGNTGDMILMDLEASSIETAFERIDGESRRTITVVATSDGKTMSFNEPGPHVNLEEWQGFKKRFERLLDEVQIVICSGSVPPGLPTDAYATLVAAARSREATTIVDAEGSSLRAAAIAGADIIKPNGFELQDATGQSDPIVGAVALQRAGASAVVVSLGADGLVAVMPAGTWRAVPPTQGGNPTGAGDACVASLAAGIELGRSWPEILRNATALSAASVRCPIAGGYDQSAYLALKSEIRLEELDATDIDA